jgi:hypothetical protein
VRRRTKEPVVPIQVKHWLTLDEMAEILAAHNTRGLPTTKKEVEADLRFNLKIYGSDLDINAEDVESFSITDGGEFVDFATAKAAWLELLGRLYPDGLA